MKSKYMDEKVILVNEANEEIGLMQKMDAHVQGVLHRAFSVVLLNDKGKMLLQRRAMDKYHSAGLWSNTCCSHPRVGEEILVSAKRRLNEEMGIQCNLQPWYNFIYRADVGNGLIENEYDHVFIGLYSEEPVANTSEVCEWKFISTLDLLKEMQQAPEQFTPWFHLIVEKFVSEPPIFLV